MHERVEGIQRRSKWETFCRSICRIDDRGRVAKIVIIPEGVACLFLHQVGIFFSLAVVNKTESDRTFGELLAVRLFFENLDSVGQSTRLSVMRRDMGLMVSTLTSSYDSCPWCEP